MPSSRSRRVLLVAFALTSLQVESASLWVAGTTYKVTDLGSLGGGAIAYGINNSGQVVGESLLSDNHTSHAFLYSGGIMRDLGTLGGLESGATGINDRGEVVGWSDTGSDRHAFLYSAGTMQDLGTLGGSPSYAEGINNNGQVVGWSVTSDNTQHAFLYSGGAMQDLGTLGGCCSSAYAINNSGQVVGTSFLKDDQAFPAFLYSGGIMRDIGSLGGAALAVGINNSGQIVGESYLSPAGNLENAFLYSGGIMRDLSGGAASGINDSGQIVGVSGAYRAFLYMRGAMVDLNTLIDPGLRLTLQWATAINNSGQIVANGIGQIVGHRAPTRAFLLAPSLSVDRVTMRDSHTLGIDVSASLPADSLQKTIQISTTPIGDRPGSSHSIALDSTTCATACTAQIAPDVSGSYTHSFLIDLTQLDNGIAVPRFTDNQILDVTATVLESGSVIETGTKTGSEIPLPTVHVHGVLTDCAPAPVHPNRIPAKLFNFLKGLHAYQVDPGFPDLSVPYPTLVSFDYHSVGEDAGAAAVELQNWIQETLLDPNAGLTYAAKVNIVAHSLGGIVSRAAIMNGMGGSVNKLVLVGSPTEGAVLAVIASNEHVPGALSNLANAIEWAAFFGSPIPALVDQRYRDTLACLGSATTQSTSELWPTYGWYGRSTADVTAGNVKIPAPNYVNVFLTNLNAWGLDPRVRYFTIISSTWGATQTNQTPTYLWGRNWVVPPSGAMWDGYFSGGVRPAYTDGDGIVPGRSQAANDQAWPIGIGPGQLYRFDDVRGVFHTAYFENAQVNQDIETILWHTP